MPNPEYVEEMREAIKEGQAEFLVRIPEKMDQFVWIYQEGLNVPDSDSWPDRICGVRICEYENNKIKKVFLERALAEENSEEVKNDLAAGVEVVAIPADLLSRAMLFESQQ